MTRWLLLTALPLLAQDPKPIRGILLDAPCTTSINVSDSRTPTQNPTTRRLPDIVPCQATITSTAFAILTDDDRTLRLGQMSNGIGLKHIEQEQHWTAAGTASSVAPSAGTDRDTAKREGQST